MLIDKARSDLARLLAEQEAISKKIEEARVILSWLERNGDEWRPETPSREATQVARQPIVLQDPEPERPSVDSEPKGFLGISASTLKEGFRGKSIADAAIVLLTMHGNPLTEVELANGLIAGGVTLIGAVPATNVRFALTKKAKETRAVVALPGLSWGLLSWSNVEGPSHANASGAQSVGRKSGDHMENARRGLMEAQKRGVKLGRPSVYSQDTKEAASALFAQGMSIRQTAKSLGINATTIGKWRVEWARLALEKAEAAAATGGRETTH